MPEATRAELEQEGIELIEERIRGRVTYRGYESRVASVRVSGDQPTVAALDDHAHPTCDPRHAQRA